MSKQLTPLEAWKVLRREWLAANLQARTARQAVSDAFQRALENGGIPPTQAQVHECEKMEKTADFLSGELDKLAHKYLI
jgi:hypothetical protein